MKKRLIFVPALLLLVGCGASFSRFVRSERMVYEYFAPEYKAYVEADANLDDTEKGIRLRGLEAWDMKLKQAEGEE